MPDSAPSHRSKAIEDMGVAVDRMPSADLKAGVRQREEAGDVCKGHRESQHSFH